MGDVGCYTRLAVISPNLINTWQSRIDRYDMLSSSQMKPRVLNHEGHCGARDMYVSLNMRST